MFLTIDIDSEVPIYQQLRDRVVEAIARGQLRVGDPLPSTRQLAADFGVNFHTINKSYSLLRQEGLLRLNRKSGAVVQRDGDSGSPDPAFVEQWRERLATLLAEAAAQGLPRKDAMAITEALLDDFAGHGKVDKA